jgi:hypothetical protein
MKATRDTFLDDLRSKFPDVLPRITKYEDGLLHCEVAALRTHLEAALSKKKEWECEKVLRYVGDLLLRADEPLENALLVSFLEDLALGDLSDGDKQIIRQRAPAGVLQVLRRHMPI